MSRDAHNPDADEIDRKRWLAADTETRRSQIMASREDYGWPPLHLPADWIGVEP